MTKQTMDQYIREMRQLCKEQERYGGCSNCPKNNLLKACWDDIIRQYEDILINFKEYEDRREEYLALLTWTYADEYEFRIPHCTEIKGEPTEVFNCPVNGQMNVI